MLGTANARPARLPGNRIKRLIGGLPEPPDEGVVEGFQPTLQAVAHILERFEAPRATTVALLDCSVSDGAVALLRADVAPIELGDLECGVSLVPPEAFAELGTQGTVFDAKRRVGRPADQPSVRGSRTAFSGGGRAADSLLGTLLPILLPPVRTDLGEEPLSLPHPLYAFQGDGVRWLIEHEPGALLADDMGLGKTVQAIIALRRLFREGRITRALIVAPKAVVTNWYRHLQEWAPELEAIEVGGSPTERQAQWTAVAANRAHVVITNYDSAVNDIDRVSSIPFGALVIDELQNLKNASTKRHRELKRVMTTRRWGLSGTPLENRVDELATLIRFLDETLLRPNTLDVHEIKTAAARIMLRRRKEEVLKELPDLRSDVVFVSLGSRQRATYEQAEREGIAELHRGSVTLTNVLALITALKQICNGVPGESAKGEWLNQYLETVTEEGDSVLVFSQFVETLKRLETDMREFGPLMYTGAMSGNARQQAVDRFQAGKHSLFLMSLKAGGVGLTLTEANHVVHFDSWWNPAVMSQATARAHRIGQKKAVFERTIVAEGTIEERIQNILRDKRDLFDAVVDDLSTTGLARALTEAEIFGLFNLEPPRRGTTA